MHHVEVTTSESFFRCGFPTKSLKAWLAAHAGERLRIATYGLSHVKRLGHYVPRNVSLRLLVGASGVKHLQIDDLHELPQHQRWSRLLDRLGPEERRVILRLLAKLNGWQHSGASVRVALPGPAAGLMHSKLYLADNVALVGSANFTLQGIEGSDQHEILLEVTEPILADFSDWWESAWDAAWPIAGGSDVPGPNIPTPLTKTELEKCMIPGVNAPRILAWRLGRMGAQWEWRRGLSSSTSSS